jgi:hypothetical protein
MPPDPNQLILLTTCATEFEAQALANALDARAIPAKVFSAAARMVQWEGGIANQAKVFVRRVDSNAALEVLRSLRTTSRGIDWNTFDVGEMEPGETPAPPRRGPRIHGLSPLMWRIRIIGFTLMALPFMVSMAGPDRGIFAIAFCVLIAILADPGVPIRATGQRLNTLEATPRVTTRLIGPNPVTTPSRIDGVSLSPADDKAPGPPAG